MKEGSSDYEKVRNRWFFKEPLTEWNFDFVEPKNGYSMASLEEPFEAPLILRVEVCILLGCLCSSVSKSSDSILSEHCPNFLEVVGIFTGMYFRVHFHSFYALSVINCGCFSQPIRSLLVAGGFQTLDFSMPFVFAIVLIDLLFSFSTQIACFSLKVSTFFFIMVSECHHRMQDSECKSNGYNRYDTFPAFDM